MAKRKARGSGGRRVDVPSAAQRYEAGRKLRTKAPRSSHAEWEPSSRRDPMGLIIDTDASRVQELVPIRYGRMATSPFAFYRGAAAVMAYDLKDTPVSGINAQICGDAHLSNFGLFGTPERRIIFDVNDFDETRRGPWEWDVKRLAASCFIAARDEWRASTAEQRCGAGKRRRLSR